MNSMTEYEEKWYSCDLVFFETSTRSKEKETDQQARIHTPKHSARYQREIVESEVAQGCEALEACKAGCMLKVPQAERCAATVAGGDGWYGEDGWKGR